MTFTEIKNKVGNKTLPLAGTTDSNNTCIVGGGSRDGEKYYTVETLQKNGWIRVETYWEDGTVEEDYRK